MNNESNRIITPEMLREEEEHAKREAERLGVTSLGQGSFHSNSCAVFGGDDFWNDAITGEVFCQHTRVPELKGWMSYQVKATTNGRIAVRTLQYKMTTRYGDWYRGNMDIHFSSNGKSSITSPDAMWQRDPAEWISYVFCGSVLSDGRGISVSIHCDFDGTNNDGWMFGAENYHSIK